MADNMGDVITIDNFTAKMSHFDPSSTVKPLYGLVDMGSNGIRFSISDLSPPQSRLLRCVYRERAGISLYDALHETTADSQPFHFSDSTITQVALTMARFKRICDSYGVHKDCITAFATEAMRTAENREAMLKAIKDASGLLVDILSPETESLFGAMGARSGFADAAGLFMDLGGGSVQMTYVPSGPDVATQAARAARSLPFGAAKLTATLSTQDAGETARSELRESMKSAFQELKGRFNLLTSQVTNNDGVTIYFCGGGFRGYGSMLMHTDPIQPYPIPAIGGYTVPGNRFSQWQEMLKANSQDGKIFGMSKRRREQFPAIVTVVQALIEAVPNIKQVIFCSGGNREGVLYMKLSPSVRESHPLAILGEDSDPDRATVNNFVVDTIISALPQGYPEVITHQLLQNVAKVIWADIGDAADTNSTKSLHSPISGSLSNVPGFTHQLRAVLSLIVCARWGCDLGPIDKNLHDNLRVLIGPQLSWWCDYIGKISNLLGTVLPTCPQTVQKLKQTVVFSASTSHGLGSKGHKVGIRLRIAVDPSSRTAISVRELEGKFDNIGKGLHLGWKVEAEVDDL
jgi:retrograde regulation protein 2